MIKNYKSKELAIIIPVLNCLEYTKKLLPTIESKIPYKVIFIDNASTDGTKEFLDLLSKDPRYCVFHFKENKGCSASWNFGIKRAIRDYGSKYFLILNNDILLNPIAIDLLISTISRKNVVLASATDVSSTISRPNEVRGLLPPVKTAISEAPEFSCFLLSLKAIEKVGYFDEKFFPAYFEDNDYHYRIRLAGLKAVKTNQALYFHFGSRTIKDNQEIHRQSDLGYVANREYYRNKWGGSPGHELFKTPYGGKK